MRWEAWPFVAIYLFGILTSYKGIGKPREPITEGMAIAVSACSLVLIWLALRLGGPL